MVMKKRLNYGFSGYQFPSIPRAPRSLRRRGSIQKSVEDDNHICAFELLASVAGKLLQESESSTSSNGGTKGTKPHRGSIKQEPIECKADCIDQGSCIESVFVPEAPQHIVKNNLKKYPPIENDYVSDQTHKIIEFGLSEKLVCKQNAIANIPSEEPKGCELPYGDSNVDNTCGFKEPTELCIDNTNILINSDSSVQLYRNSVPNDSFPGHRDDAKIGDKDDEENLFGCKQVRNKRRYFRPPSHIGYRNIRKTLMSRYWDAAPKLKDCEIPNTGGGLKGFYRNRKIVYKRGGCEPENPSKRRKLFGNSSTVVYDQEASSESISNLPEKGCSTAIFQRTLFQSKDPHVKMSIKSFRIPELFVEVPETTTVGSLKRTIMDAVTAILGGQLHVGVLLQGKKVRDDSRTLLQTGIQGNLDNVGFSLEPSFAQASSLPTPKDRPSLLASDTHQQLSKSSASPILDLGVSNMTCDLPLMTILGSHDESKHEIVPYSTDASKDIKMTVSKALVPVTSIKAEALAVVPLNQRTNRSELSQRRTRRPFSVPEVEALVEAVEKLGTGRWRDVKIRSFSEANHRTYVDLKDKWKTLVHTASIAPQQRRGEPVPQELLDRVLMAHAYWSRHQSLQHGKHQTEPLKLCG